jgi:hypothetical protein
MVAGNIQQRSRFQFTSIAFTGGETGKHPYQYGWTLRAFDNIFVGGLA